MHLFRRLRAVAGQTATEYMVVLSVVSIAAMAAFSYFGESDKPVQQAAADVANNYADGLTNQGGKMQAN